MCLWSVGASGDERIESGAEAKGTAATSATATLSTSATSTAAATTTTTGTLALVLPLSSCFQVIIIMSASFDSLSHKTGLETETGPVINFHFDLWTGIHLVRELLLVTPSNQSDSGSNYTIINVTQLRTYSAIS